MWLTRYFNATARRRCLDEREASGAPKFCRRRGHVSQPQSPGIGDGTMRKRTHNRSLSNELLRRTPSPHGHPRIHADSAGAETASPVFQRRIVHDRKISLEEITRSRSSSTGTKPPPIREDSASSMNSALSTPDITHSSPRFDRAFANPSSLPRRSSTLDPPARRTSACMRMSRVLVMPSVAMVSYSPEPLSNNNNSS